MSLNEYKLEEEINESDEEQFTVIFDKNEAEEIKNQLTNELNEAKSQIEILKSEKFGFKEEIYKISTEFSFIEAENKNLNEIINKKDSEINKLTQELIETKNEAEKQNKNIEAQREHEKFVYKEKFTKILYDLKIIRVENKKLHEIINQKDSEINELNEEIIELKNEIEVLKQNIEAKNEEEVKYESVESSLVLNPIAVCESLIEDHLNIVPKLKNENLHLSLSDKVIIVKELLASAAKSPEKQKKFKCFVCDKIYYKECSLKRHLNTHKKEKNRILRSGRQSTIKRVKIVKNKKSKQKKEIKCMKCSQMLTSEKGLKIHDKKMHSTIENVAATAKKQKRGRKPTK